MNKFDQWRKDYDTMTLEQQIEFHNQIAQEYPEQAHYDYEAVSEVLDTFRPRRVLEFGCWRADMAQQALNQFDFIDTWTGIEICTKAMDMCRCSSNKFQYILPTKFNWFEDKRKYNADMIMATHFIEHLANTHFEQLTKYCKGVPYVYFECPITEDGQEWDDDVSTHKLEYGWKDVISLMKSQGYVVHKTHLRGVSFKTYE
jgi:hypothetical protein